MAGAATGPETCLALRANGDVAACANQYAPAAPPGRTRSVTLSSPAASTAARRDEHPLLQSVAVVRTQPADPPIGPVRSAPAPDRTWLTDAAITGAAGALALIVVALGMWRWAASHSRACRYCGGRLSREARACRQCFRAV
jgi:hypothetical protein